MLDLPDGGVIPAEWQLNVLIRFLVFEVAIALLHAVAMLTVVHLCHDVCGVLTVQVVLEVNALSGQHLA